MRCQGRRDRSEENVRGRLCVPNVVDALGAKQSKRTSLTKSLAHGLSYVRDIRQKRGALERTFVRPSSRSVSATGFLRSNPSLAAPHDADHDTLNGEVVFMHVDRLHRDIGGLQANPSVAFPIELFDRR